MWRRAHYCRVAANKMHDGEVEIDAEIVRRLLVTQFPQWCDLPLEPVHSTGTVNAIYRLGSDLCVRLPRVRGWAGDLEKELRWLPTLAPQLPLAVPEPLAAGHADGDYPFSWGIYRWLGGETFASDRIDDEDRAATDLARFVATLRRIDTADAPRSKRDRPLRAR